MNMQLQTLQMIRTCAVLACACAAQAQAGSYWLSGSGAPWRDAAGQCVRSNAWSVNAPHPACDALPDRVVPPDRVVLLPGPDGKVGAVMVQSGQGQQLIDRAFAGVSVTSDGKQTAGLEDAAAVQQRYAAVLQAQPERPVNLVVRFAAGSATELTPDSLPQIAQLKAVLKVRTLPEITVIGHTDRVGAVEANDQLSVKRAESVKQILTAAGISAASIEVAGRGEREPLVPGPDGVAEPANRRVEINVR